MALDVAEGEPVPEGVTVDPQGNMLTGKPHVSALAWSLCYSYPVHELGPDNCPPQPPEQPTYLVVYRNLENKVKFMAINAVTARLIHILTDNETESGEAALRQIADELQHPDPQQMITLGAGLLEKLRAASIITGTLA